MAAVAPPSTQAFHRKPVPSHAANGNYTPAQRQSSQQSQPPQNVAAPAALNTSPAQSQRNSSQGYTASTSQHSSMSPAPAPPLHKYPQQPQPPSSQPQHPAHSRTLSQSTTTSSTSNQNSANRLSTNSAYGGGIRRSTSSRSTSSASPTSYVALMRKQKATVWCDRAQHQDPRILAAQRQAKMRAHMEVAGGQNHINSARVAQSSSGITSKIRHHGAQKANQYNSGNLSGAGVPMRLSASEVDDIDSDEEARSHQRASSARSSMGSGNGYGYRGYTNGASPSAASPVDDIGELAEEETPVPGQFAGQNDYFGQNGGTGGSGSSGEAEKSFGGVSNLPESKAKEHEFVSSDELRRRGSVDDRTMTMSAGRLFVANPDLSD